MPLLWLHRHWIGLGSKTTPLEPTKYQVSLPLYLYVLVIFHMPTLHFAPMRFFQWQESWRVKNGRGVYELEESRGRIQVGMWNKPKRKYPLLLEEEERWIEMSPVVRRPFQGDESLAVFQFKGSHLQSPQSVPCLYH